MRVEMPSTRWSKLRTGLHSWTMRSSREDDLQRQLARCWILVFSWPDWSFVTKAHAGAIDQEPSTDMTGAEISRDALEQPKQDASQEVQESAFVLRVLFMLCTVRALGRIANGSAWLGHGGVADALGSVFPEGQCKVGCDDAGGFGVSVGHERCGERSGDNGKEDEGVRETMRTSRFRSSSRLAS